ncbi:hypothetical protein [Treponema pedis]|uniref:hypothetical protein n=1 Tax=Treponema pedis TaxID=409322 RepID=UPI0031341366
MKNNILVVLSLTAFLFLIFSCSKKQENLEVQPETGGVQLELVKGNFESTNPLMKADFVEAFVKNGLKTEIVGVSGIVKISEDEFNSLSLENYAEFCKFFSGRKKYKWVSIISENQKGVIFAGGGNLGTHAVLNADGSTNEVIDDWILIYDSTTGKVTKE